VDWKSRFRWLLEGRRPWIAAGVVVVLLVAAGVTGWALSGSDGDPAKGGTASRGQEPGSARIGASAAASCADATLAKLDLAGQVGQLLMVGVPVATPQNGAQTVTRYKLGGVFLAGRYKESASKLKDGIDKLQKAASTPILVAADQEGGDVQTLQGADFGDIPTAVTQGKLSQDELAAQTTEWAKKLRAAGVTIDLAPVADVVPVDVGKANPPIGQYSRQYGPTPDEVAPDVVTVMKALQGAGVLTTVKHFPGLGRVRANTDTSTEARDSVTTVDDPALQPFAQAIAAGTTAVMISSAHYPKLDNANVAAFSTAVVTALLRQKMGFTGLVLSDDLGAAVAVKDVPVGDRAVRFINAGGDVVLTVKTTDAGPMSDALLKEAGSDKNFAARVKESAGRVLRAKATAGILAC
jgi:beta-N-acetylhexosaminidase